MTSRDNIFIIIVTDQARDGAGELGQSGSDHVLYLSSVSAMPNRSLVQWTSSGPGIGILIVFSLFRMPGFQPARLFSLFQTRNPFADVSCSWRFSIPFFGKARLKVKTRLGQHIRLPGMFGSQIPLLGH